MLYWGKITVGIFLNANNENFDSTSHLTFYERPMGETACSSRLLCHSTGYGFQSVAFVVMRIMQILVWRKTSQE